MVDQRKAVLFRKQFPNSGDFRFNVQSMEGLDVGQVFENVDDFLAGSLQLSFKKIPDPKSLAHTLEIGSVDGDPGDGVIFVKMVQQVHREISKGILLAVQIYLVIPVVCREDSFSCFHEFFSNIYRT